MTKNKNSALEGIVQRKLMRVISDISRQLFLYCLGACI
jgi:hypothetical protein